MALEIERKFLLRDDGWRAQVQRSVPMAQAYLNDLQAIDGGAVGASVRVRIEGEAARLNLKSREVGRSRQEFDYPIPMDDARALMALAVGLRVEKTRHFVAHGAHVWEIDEFGGDNAGLVVAEIELAHLDEDFARPGWLGAEVTLQTRYYNLALAARPFCRWNAAERAGHVD